MLQTRSASVTAGSRACGTRCARAGPTLTAQAAPAALAASSLGARRVACQVAHSGGADAIDPQLEQRLLAANPGLSSRWQRDSTACRVRTQRLYVCTSGLPPPPLHNELKHLCS